MQEKAMSKVGELESKVSEMGSKAGSYVDDASTSIGRSLETAADKLATRAETASDGLAKAGRYLQDADTKQMGRDLTHFVKQHPTVSLAAGFGLGLLIGRAISR